MNCCSGWKVLDVWYEKFNNMFKHGPSFWTRKDKC